MFRRTRGTFIHLSSADCFCGVDGGSVVVGGCVTVGGASEAGGGAGVAITKMNV